MNGVIIVKQNMAIIIKPREVIMIVVTVATLRLSPLLSLGLWEHGEKLKTMN
jgi:hypothetical protein